MDDKQLAVTTFGLVFAVGLALQSVLNQGILSSGPAIITLVFLLLVAVLAVETGLGHDSYSDFGADGEVSQSVLTRLLHQPS